MKESWFHYRCDAGHVFMVPERQATCECGLQARLSFVEKVPAGYYEQSREREVRCDSCGREDVVPVHNSETTAPCNVAGCEGRMWPLIKGAPLIPTDDLAMGEAASGPAIDKWQKQREQKQKIEEKIIRDHGSL